MTSHMPTAAFPATRLRRNRLTDWRRRLVRQHELCVNDLILAIVVHDGVEARIPVISMPGVFRYSRSEAVKVAIEAEALGIPMIAVFPFNSI